ncbi:MAG: hypothetical protein HN729_08200 [Candidatus Marinimicrobia bacterium]|jgi:hypothetical protein|nr:hypothetical protein [Candidatus Neomarinimicrobiota bacterium]MBT3635121.1 hypothetical protein [Candidatus Neomarinimicrobiota bacterium]MBT3683008.1 hypothetical protein [Candidatus Neomarinimicrobiota bacterium]MBT3759900.1 hypothetical protein [Candidatus Neomarinimicrobiota bacterium]MBT3895647.1 hypothetical protein [Candidatus Neomarinimicrobiota bacterium]
MSIDLSIVATSRNDDHGGDTLKRMRIFVNGLLVQTRKSNLDIELIIVEWNPPLDRPLLKEVLPAPSPGDKLIIRYVVVPLEIHSQYKQQDAIPLFQMIAKNVGIRRALGKFVLCTNIDLLFSKELFQILEENDLDSQCFYRANRCDVPAEIQENWPLEKQLTFATENILSTAGKNNQYVHLITAPEWVYKYAFVAKFFQLAAKVRARILEEPIGLQLRLLDTDACGDFTLMSKEAWLDIQGYAELDLYSIHIDSLGIIAAAALGYKQVILPPEACTFHIHHETGWASMSPIEKIKFWSERPGIGWDAVLEAGRDMLKDKLRLNVNDDNWGFSDEKLEEYILEAETVD